MSFLVLVGGAAAFALVALLAIARAASSHAWSDTEYERRRRAPSSGLLAASMRVLGEELGPGGKRVAEERAALERGERESGPTADGQPPQPR